MTTAQRIIAFRAELLDAISDENLIDELVLIFTRQLVTEQLIVTEAK